jgi:hypothetical protein
MTTHQTIHEAFWVLLLPAGESFMHRVVGYWAWGGCSGESDWMQRPGDNSWMPPTFNRPPDDQRICDHLGFLPCAFILRLPVTGAITNACACAKTRVRRMCALSQDELARTRGGGLSVFHLSPVPNEWHASFPVSRGTVALPDTGISSCRQGCVPCP